MKPIISVKDIVDELELSGEGISSFLNKRTGEIVTLGDEYLSAAENEDEDDDNTIERPEWEQETIAQAKEVINTDDYLQLPGKYDINEYKVIEEFCNSVEDEKIRDILLVSIKGKGAFSRFKDTIRMYNIENEWYNFRQKELEKIAINWLEANHIPYTQDEK